MGHVKADVFHDAKADYWGLPGDFVLIFLRNISGLIIVLYIAGRSVTALLQRTSAAQIMIVLYMAGVAGALALAFNLTDIRPEPRYMLPFMTAATFALILFTTKGLPWEKWTVSICLGILTIFALVSAQDRRGDALASQDLHAQIQNVFTQTGTEVGLTYMGGAGMINLGLGVGDFIPVKMNKDGNISTVPFHTNFYYQNYEAAEQTGLVYVTSDSFASATDADLNEFLAENGFALLHTEVVISGTARVRIMIVRGDIRSVFPGSPKASRPAKRFVAKESQYRVGTVEPGKSCNTHIYVPEDELGFSFAESAFMISSGTYQFTPVFDNDPPDINTLVIALATDQEKDLHRALWDGEPIMFEVTKMGLLRIVLSGKKASGFKFCGSEIRKVSDAN